MSPLQVKDGALHGRFLLTCLASSASFCSLCVCRRLLQPAPFAAVRPFSRQRRSAGRTTGAVIWGVRA